MYLVTILLYDLPGKTHTILGNAEQPGVIPRAVKDLLSMVSETRNQLNPEEWQINAAFSYLEIYNEKVRVILL